MKKARSIKKVFYGNRTTEGAGVRLNRFFSQDETSLFDPFLLFDDFSSRKRANYINGFPWHPHRGLETITYMLKGAVRHEDTLGNNGLIKENEVQWMTAGSGIIHQEMPQENAEKGIVGFQLWANLPAKKKMTSPLYRNITTKKIPIIKQSDKVSIRIIAGEMDGHKGPVNDIVTEPIYFDIFLPPQCEFVYPTPFDFTFFAYLFNGSGSFGEYTGPDSTDFISLNGEILPHIDGKAIILFSEGDFISVASTKGAARFLLIGGKPLKEPIAWYGPIVMNTDEELKKAFEEFQIGTFIKK